MSLGAVNTYWFENYKVPALEIYIKTRDRQYNYDYYEEATVVMK